MTSSFPVVSSAPPSSVTGRMMSNTQLNRVPASNAHQQVSSRFKTTYDSRRYSNTQTPYKRSVQQSTNSNHKATPTLARVEVAPLPSARLVLQQQTSSPGRLQHQTQQSASSPQFPLSNNPMLDPPNIGRIRPAPLPPPTVRNGIHRNAVSLNALPINQHGGVLVRGRSQNSAHKGSVSSRTTRIRQQSLVPFDIQQATTTYPSAGVMYPHPLHTDSPPVFFE